MNSEQIKLGIGIPLSWNYVPSDFFDSCIMLLNDLPVPVEILRANSGPIHEMRNAIVSRAIAMGCTHLLFLDADMVYPADTIHKLLGHDKAIVGALTFKRYPNFNPLTFGGDEYNLYQIEPEDDTLMKVTATGTGCLMIAMEVFNSLEYPWFQFSENNGKPVGEDINFCYNAKRAGFEIYVDTSIRTEHLCNMRVNWNVYQMQKSLLADGKPGFTF